MKKLAILGANESLLPFYKQLIGKYYLIGIAWAEGAVCKQYCDKFYPVSFAEKDKILAICQDEKIDGITSFSLESALPTVVYVAQHMNLVSNSFESVELTKTKYSQRECLRKNRIPTPYYTLLKKADDINNVKLDFPLIIKPVDSGGSQGVHLVYDLDSLKEAYQDSIKYSKAHEVIVEKYIDGREFSVESISCNGIHYILQITDKVTTGAPHFVEVQHHQPADITLDLSKKIKDIIKKALTALQITNSPCHSEIKLSSKGELFIIEIGARLGGGSIGSDLVRLSTGYNYALESVKLACGDFERPLVLNNKCSGIYFYNKLQKNVRNYIINKNLYPEIVEAVLNSDDLNDVISNLDRNNGYIIYQSDSKFII